MVPIKFMLLVLLVIAHLVLLINLFPDIFEKFVIGSLILTAKILREENNVRNNVNWSTLFIIFLNTCATIIAITVTTTILCVILKNHRRALFVFYACITTSFFLDIMVFIYVYYNLNYGSKNMIKDWLDASVYDYKKPGREYIRIIWDNLQSTFKCCGYRSPNDWTQPSEFDETEHGYNYVPESCCIETYPCGAGSYDNQTSYWVGCGQKISHITVVAEIIGWAFGVLAILKVAAVIFANCYITYIKKTSLILPTTRVYTINNRRMRFRNHQNINDTLRADIIRDSAQKK